MNTTAPNLDAMTRKELQAFAGTNAKEADEAINALPEPIRPEVRRRLVNYAYSRMAAIDCRLDGGISAALAYEARCDRAYDLLPDSVKW